MHRPSRTTQLAFEQVEGYPPPAALPPLDTLESYLREYAAVTDLPLKAARLLFGLAGFPRRLGQLRGDPAFYERALRDVPARMMVSNALMFSATTVLRDEEPSPDPIDRASRLIAGARSFYADLLAARLPADTFRGEPMEMGQYRNLFSTCNYPSGMCLPIYKSRDDSHIVVAASGSYYRLRLPPTGAPLDVPSLRAALEAVTADARGRREGSSPGPLTGAAPLQRAAGFSLIRLDRRNRKSLEALADAFLVLCLDLDSFPADEEQACRLAQSRNRRNRWYLASTQIVVFGNARTSIVFSYICGIDGNVMTRFSSEVRRRALRLSGSAAAERKPEPVEIPERLRFAIPARLVRWADASCRGLLSEERVLFRIRGWGGEGLLRRGLRLDSVFNIAMMMAEEKLTGRRPVHVELLTMAKYRYRGLGDATPWSPAVSRLADPALNAGRGRDAVETLREALEAHYRSLKEGRERFNLSDLLSLHLALSAPWQAPFIMVALMKYMSSIDVIVSFPHPSEDVLAVGRMGTRLLTRLFSLHYETSPEMISVAFMPAIRNAVPAQTAFAAFEEALQKIVRIAQLLPESEGKPLIRVERGPLPAGDRVASGAMPK
jgi:hypothetical protein